MMTGYAWFTINRDGATYAADVHIIEGLKPRNDGYCMVMLHRRYWRYMVEMTRDENGMEPAAILLRLRYALPVDGRLNWQAQVKGLGRMMHRSTVSVRRTATCTDTKQSLLC